MAETFRCRIVRLENKPRCHLVIDNYDEVYHKDTIWQKEPPSYCEHKEGDGCSCCAQCCTCGG